MTTPHPDAGKPGELPMKCWPNGLADDPEKIDVACITLDGATLTVPVADFARSTDGMFEDCPDTVYQLTFKTMSRSQYEALGDFDGF